VYSRTMSCAVGSTWPSGGRRTTRARGPTSTRYVRFDRPPVIWVERTGPSSWGQTRASQS